MIATDPTITPAQSPLTQRRVLLLTLWIFVVLNYLYADVIGLMDARVLRQFLDGKVDGLELTRTFLFMAAVMMEVPIAMVALSRLLPRRANRIANIAAGLFKTVAVAASLSVGTPAAYYVFFATIEMACTLSIVYLAYTWHGQAVSEGQTLDAARV